MLHRWAGRSAGGFGRSKAGVLGHGKYGKWAHRPISSVRDAPHLSELDKISIFFNYKEESAQLFDRWLLERNLMGYVQRVEEAPQFHELLNGGVDWQGVKPSESHYYQIPPDIDNLELDGRSCEWVRRYHGTYIYTLWNILVSGFMGNGVKDEGGDTHIPNAAGIVYTTPNPDLAHSYACPHQLFGNGFLFKVVLDLRVRKHKLYRSHRQEDIFFARDVRVAGFWLFTDSRAQGNDSRILEWNPKFEAIPPSVVASWHAQGADIETVMPTVITDPAPKFMPLELTGWDDHVMIYTP